MTDRQAVKGAAHSPPRRDCDPDGSRRYQDLTPPENSNARWRQNGDTGSLSPSGASQETHGQVSTWSLRGRSEANLRGTATQDRWGAGFLTGLCWAAVADGISGGPQGAAAAQAALGAVTGLLTATCASPVPRHDVETLLYRCVDTAQSAVAPWYAPDHPGGTTLTICLLDDVWIGFAAVGDSPAHVAKAGQPWVQLSPAQAPGGLASWIGAPTAPDPWIELQSASAWDRVLLTTDGVDVTSDWRSSPDLHLSRLFDNSPRNGDDSTAVMLNRAVLPAEES